MPAFLTIVAVLATILSSCASGHREPFDSDLPEVRDLAAFEAELREAVEGFRTLTLEVAGRVAYDGFEAPVWVVRHRGEAAERSVLVTGGVHGNEPAGAAWVVALARDIAARPEAYRTVSMDLFPLVNPWGWSRDQRFNRDGRDINRDFATFATPEARIVRDFIAGRRYDLAVDHHEDPNSAGAYIYQYAMRDASVSRSVIGAWRSDGVPIEQDVRMVILRTRDGLIDAPRWGLLYMRLTGQLSLTNFVRLENAAVVYTPESPTHLPFDRRLAIHRAAFEILFRSHAEP